MSTSSALRTIRLGWAYTLLNLKTVYREPAALFFVLLLPILFLVIFPPVLTSVIEIPAEARGYAPEIPFNQYFMAGIIAVAIFGTSFNLLGNQLAIRQYDGTLKQLAATPLPKASFFIGLVVTALVYTFLQLVIMLTIAAAAYGIELPDAAGWLRLIWVVLLGVPAGCVLGIAITKIIPSANAATAVIQAAYLPLWFVSGVFFVLDSHPTWLQWLAGIFPLRWVAQGLRSAFLPDAYKFIEPGMSWQLDTAAIVLGVWIAAGLVLAAATFKWDRSG